MIYEDTQSSGSISNDMTAHPDAGKPTIVSTPANENKNITVSTAIPDDGNWDDTIVYTPNDDIMDNPFELPGYNVDQDFNKPTVVTSTPWLNSDGSLIWQSGSGAIREVSGNADPNQAAWDFVQKAIGGKEV